MRHGMLVGLVALAPLLLLTAACGGGGADEGSRPGLGPTEERSPAASRAATTDLSEPTATTEPAFVYVAPEVSIPKESRVYMARVAPAENVRGVRNYRPAGEANSVMFSIVPGSPVSAPSGGMVNQTNSGQSASGRISRRTIVIQRDPAKYESEWVLVGLTGETVDPSVVQGAAVSPGQLLGTASDQTNECPVCPSEGLWNVFASRSCPVPAGAPSGSSRPWCDIYADEQGNLYVAR